MALGKLNYIKDLRAEWQHEEKDFTPWLADNISLLGEALGLNLEVISTEHDVGSFSLDILSKDIDSGNFVAIENQLEITDHTHLGQILTYASGVDANTVIWISKEVREEHRKAIDWLNQITNEDIEFFAVEIKLIQIGDSDIAPFFNVKASPNDWSKEQKTKITSSSGITERQEYYHEFFTSFLNLVNIEMPNLTNSKKVSYDSCKTFPAGVSGYSYSAAIRSGNRFSIELYIDTGNKEINKDKFANLEKYKIDIEDKLGELSWERLDNKKACRIAAYIDCTNDEEMFTWGIKKLKYFRETFKQYIN